CALRIRRAPAAWAGPVAGEVYDAARKAQGRILDQLTPRACVEAGHRRAGRADFLRASTAAGIRPTAARSSDPGSGTGRATKPHEKPPAGLSTSPTNSPRSLKSLIEASV